MEYNKPPTDPDLAKFLETSNYDSLAKYLIGNQYRFRENIIIPRLLGPVIIKTNEEKMIEATVESCPFKVITSCVIGKKLKYFFRLCLGNYNTMVSRSFDPQYTMVYLHN